MVSEDEDIPSYERRSVYDGLTHAANPNQTHLGGNHLEGDPYTFAPRVWDYLVDRFGIKSVLDLGSGMGYAASYFYRKGLQVVAIEGLAENVEHAIYPTVQIDLTEHFVKANVDLVHCQEVVEHIEEKYIDNLLTSLANGKFILMTNALPNQGGFHHVNEQPIEYWVQQMARYNCHVLAEDTNRIRGLADQEGARYLAKTGTLYVNKNKVTFGINPEPL